MDEEVIIGDNTTLDSHEHDGSVYVNSIIKDSENPDVDFLETEAAEKISQKEINHLRLKEKLLLCHVGSEENKSSHSHSMLEQNVESFGRKSLVLEKTKEIAGLRRELELISKLLTGHENGNIKAMEDKRRSSVSASSVWDTNCKHIGSVTLTPEKLEDLRRLSCEQLISHFTTEMNQLKREHDYTIQEITEEYFSIKRRFLNLEENVSFPSLKKTKEFDVPRKKIQDIINKLDMVLMECEELVFEGENGADVKILLDSLLLENRLLKDLLSEGGEKLSQVYQVEANHRKLIQKLESDAEYSHVEASVYADVYGSFVGEFVNQIQCAKEETDLEHYFMREASYELIPRDLVNKEAFESKSDVEDSCGEAYMAGEWCGVMYKEALREADKNLGELNINSFEKGAWRSEMVKKERLNEEINWLKCLVKEKENLVKIVENDLATEREKLEIQINNLQFQVDQQAGIIQEKNKELEVVSARALEKTKGYEMEISELRQNLELARKNTKITENETVKFVSMVLSLAKWFDNLECLVAEKSKKTNSRFKSVQSQLSEILDEVNELKARESLYKQQMEKKTHDLQKAENEVDLLGDQIESLLDLLEKIYMALDHYSPILKHYPSIIEILKLVRRELRGESKRI